LRDQCGLVRRDFLLPAFVFRLTRGFRLPITTLDLPLLAALFFARLLVGIVNLSKGGRNFSVIR